MVRSVIAVGLDAYYRESAKGTALHSILNTFIDSRDIFLRNSAARDSIFEYIEIVRIRICRCKDDLAMAILTGTARLLRVLAVDICSPRNGLLV